MVFLELQLCSFVLIFKNHGFACFFIVQFKNIKTVIPCILKPAVVAKSHVPTLTFTSQRHRVALWQGEGRLMQGLIMRRMGELLSAKVLLQKTEKRGNPHVLQGCLCIPWTSAALSLVTLKMGINQSPLHSSQCVTCGRFTNLTSYIDKTHLLWSEMGPCQNLSDRKIKMTRI